MGKHIRLFNESINPLVEVEFTKALDSAVAGGKGSINLDAYGEEWKEYSKNIHLYDNYYIYDGSVLRLDTYETGNWYASHFIKVRETTEEFKQKILDKIEELEKSLTML